MVLFENSRVDWKNHVVCEESVYLRRISVFVKITSLQENRGIYSNQNIWEELHYLTEHCKIDQELEIFFGSQKRNWFWCCNCLKLFPLGNFWSLHQNIGFKLEICKQLFTCLFWFKVVSLDFWHLLNLGHLKYIMLFQVHQRKIYRNHEED